MKNPKALLIGLGVVAFIGFGFFFVRGPKPIIEIKGEKIAELGPLPILNTFFTAVVVAIIIIVVSWLATRKMKMIPSGLQNAVEAVAEALYNLCIQTAGEKNGRKFFPVAATIFVFIWIANWMALTPIFNSFGTVLEVSPTEMHKESQIITNQGGVGFIFPFSLGGDAPLAEFEVEQGGRPIGAKDAAVTLCAPFTPDAKSDCKKGVYAFSIAEALEREGYATEVEECGLPPEPEAKDPLAPKREPTADEREAWSCWKAAYATGAEELDADGKTLGIILPFFRSMNTDLNTPLSLAIMAVIFIEFWGIAALGVFKYGAKFINFSSPIGFFVGILEIIAEFARIISFTFRLFGNMLAGEILLLVSTFLAPFLIALPFYGLETFVGMIQAFVFFSLTVAFGALACAEHGDHGDDHGEDGHEDAHIAAHEVAPAH